MIYIVLSNKVYENDVYPLVKAFYPNDVIKVYEKNEDIDEKKLEVKQEVKLRDKQEVRIEDKHKKVTTLVCSKKIQIELLDGNISITFLLEMNEVITKSERITSCSKPEYKNRLKRLLYGMLSQVTKKELPWGILTGIRPTKIIYELLEAGYEEDAVQRHMKAEYLCSDQKIAMSVQIAKREIKLLTEIDYKNGYSLYIGIPFCPSTCLYCSFTSYSAEKYGSYMESYLKALEKEIIYASTCFPDKKLTTVYIGGGTPTTLSAQQLDWLLSKVREYFDFREVREFSVEAGRPDSITREKLLILKNHRVDRISINPQSMQQKTLDFIGRRHTVEQIKEAFAIARETGHENINMDIILGLPGENLQEVEDTLSQIKSLDPDSITVHTLAIKRAARLNMEKENYVDVKPTNVAAMLDASIQYAEDNNYLPYYLYRQKNMAENLENIGYAKFGKEGLYNILIMEEQQTILALGAGALSKFVFHKENRIERVDNVKSVTDYINRIDEMILRKQQFIENM